MGSGLCIYMHEVYDFAFLYFPIQIVFDEGLHYMQMFITYKVAHSCFPITVGALSVFLPGSVFSTVFNSASTSNSDIVF